MRRRIVLYAMALAVVTLWGASFPLTKAALDFAGPTSIAFVRWLISAVVLLGWLASRGRLGELVQLLRQRGATVLWVAVCGITLFYFLENIALQYTTATNAGVLANLTSVFMVLIGTLVLAERLSRIEWAAMALAFAGALLVSQGAGHLALAGPGLIGDLLMVVATFFAAIYSIGGKRLMATHQADTVTAANALVGSVFLLPLAIWELGGPGKLPALVDLPLQVWGALALLGIGAGALANIWWMHILGSTTAARAAMTLFLIPIIATTLSVIALGEPLTPLVIVGGGLVLAGVALVERQRSSNLGGRARRPRPYA